MISIDQCDKLSADLRLSVDFWSGRVMGVEDKQDRSYIFLFFVNARLLLEAGSFPTGFP